MQLIKIKIKDPVEFLASLSVLPLPPFPSDQFSPTLILLSHTPTIAFIAALLLSIKELLKAKSLTGTQICSFCEYLQIRLSASIHFRTVYQTKENFKPHLSERRKASSENRTIIDAVKSS